MTYDGWRQERTEPHDEVLLARLAFTYPSGTGAGQGLKMLPQHRAQQRPAAFRPGLSMYLRRLYKPRQLDIECVHVLPVHKYAAALDGAQMCNHCVLPHVPYRELFFMDRTQVCPLVDAAAVHCAQDSVSAVCCEHDVPQIYLMEPSPIWHHLCACAHLSSRHAPSSRANCCIHCFNIDGFTWMLSGLRCNHQPNVNIACECRSLISPAVPRMHFGVFGSQTDGHSQFRSVCAMQVPAIVQYHGRAEFICVCDCEFMLTKGTRAWRHARTACHCQLPWAYTKRHKLSTIDLQHTAVSSMQPVHRYRHTAYHKQTKNQWARDDPAFVIVTCALVMLAALAYCITWVHVLHAVLSEKWTHCAIHVPTMQSCLAVQHDADRGVFVCLNMCECMPQCACMSVCMCVNGCGCGMRGCACGIASIASSPKYGFQGLLAWNRKLRPWNWLPCRGLHIAPNHAPRVVL